MEPDPTARRLFVGVPVPAEPAAAFRSVLRTLAERGVRAVPADRLHLTLVFMAAVPEERVDAVTTVVRSTAADTSRFTLATTGAIGRFGARVAWAELRDGEALTALAHRLADAVGAAGVELPDRPFRAHLTLARAGRRRVTPSVVADLSAPRVTWQVREVELIHSVLGRGPAQWQRLAVCPLQTRPGS